MNMSKRFLLVAFIFVSSIIQAQNVQFEASAPNMVEVGEQFRLTYSLNSKPSNFNPPTIAGFEVIAGPSTSSSTSIEIINGKVTQQQSVSYTYILEATAVGKYNIPPAEAMVGKVTYQSNPVSIEVIKASSGSARQANQPQPTQPQQIAAGEENLPDDDLFVTIELNRKTAYMGEPVEAAIKIYTRVNILGIEDAKFPTFDGFWSQELESSSNVQFERANVNGKIYNVGIIRRYLLFPQKNEKLKIDPFELVVVYQGNAARPRSIFDEFFGGGFENYRKRLVSKPVSVVVKSLPQGAPSSFYGGVGNFKINVGVDKNKLKTNEAVTLKLVVTGTGNLKLMGTPKVEFPSTFEVFEPKVSDNINPSQQNASGSKTFEYVAIPRASGSYEIGPVDFTYFDPSAEKYVSVQSKTVNLEVIPDSSATGAVVLTSGLSKEDVKFIGKDIRFIKTNPVRLKPINSFVVGSLMYLFSYILVVILFAVFLFVFRKYRKQIQDTGFVRNKHAQKIAQKRLQVAQEMLRLDEGEKFYEEIHKALWGYASDKLNLPVASLTTESVREALSGKGVSESAIDEFIRIIEACEYARFAPSSEHLQLETIYKDTYSLILQLEENLGKVKSRLW